MLHFMKKHLILVSIVLYSAAAISCSDREMKADHETLFNAIDEYHIDSIDVAVKWYEKHGTADEKLKAYYYQSRTYLNAGDTEAAMESLVKAEAEIPEAEDNVTKGLVYLTMSQIYATISDMETAGSRVGSSKAFLRKTGDHDNYANALNLSAGIHYAGGETAKAKACLDSVRLLWDDIGKIQKNACYILTMNMKEADGDRTGLAGMLDEYLAEFEAEDIRWLDVAGYSCFLGRQDMAEEALRQYREHTPDYGNDAAYYKASCEFHAAFEDYKAAFEDLEHYSYLSDSLRIAAAGEDTGFIEERYDKELIIEKERSTKIIVIMSSAFGIALLSIAVFLLVRRMKKRNAEVARYRNNLAVLKCERDELAAAIAKNPPTDRQSMAVLNDRLKMLNDIFAAEITHSRKTGGNPYKEVERLIENHEEFLYTTRMTFKAAHPGLITFLEEKGLTNDEVEYCCLYAIGLKGKEISKFFGNRNHYKGSSVIRAKLGLGPHDTNLGNFLRSRL